MSEELRKFFNSLPLTRFTTFEDLKNNMNIWLKQYDLQVKDCGFKSTYDNDFEDFVVMFTIGNDKEDLYDLDIWFAITRIGERIITEISIEEV